jgi:hypothetical protein
LGLRKICGQTAIAKNFCGPNIKIFLSPGKNVTAKIAADRKISAKFRKIPQNFRKIPQNFKSQMTAKNPPCVVCI